MKEYGFVARRNTAALEVHSGQNPVLRITEHKERTKEGNDRHNNETAKQRSESVTLH